MELLILDENYNQIGLFEDFESLIWEERYSEAGAFEIVCIPSEKTRKFMRAGNRVIRVDESEMIGIIYSAGSDFDEDGTERWTASGRSVEYLLRKRIVADYKNYSNKNPLAICADIIDRNVISPSDSVRTIPNLQYQKSDIAADKITGQYRGENLYDAIVSLCKTAETGMRATLDDANKIVTISHYQGVDRTNIQTKNAPVTLSVDYGTLKSAAWTEDESEYANIAYVAGSGEGKARRIVSTDRKVSGESRCEIFVDARDLQQEDDSGTVLSDASYKTLLRQRGKEDLKENGIARSCDVEMSGYVYTYRENYNLGDVVSFESGNLVGIARIESVTEYNSENGREFDVGLNVLSFTYADDVSNESAILNEDYDAIYNENGVVLIW